MEVGEPNVDAMMASITSRQLSEWMAYERATGPIGRRYDQEVLARIFEQLQLIAHLLGAAHFTDKEHPDNPVPEPVKFPRPEEVYLSEREIEAREELAAAEDELASAKSNLELTEPGTDGRDALVESVRILANRVKILKGEAVESVDA